MTSTLHDRATTTDGIEVVDDQRVVTIPRRSIDKILIALGAVAALVFFIAGGLLLWGANFSNDYVYDELSSAERLLPR